MDKLLFVIIFGMLAFIVIRNFSLFKSYKHNKEYIAAYQDVLHNEENCYERICNYIDNEDLESYQNKARIIKLYCELNNDINYKNTLDVLDIKSIYYSKDKIDNDCLKYNTDSFIFLMLVETKAYEKDKAEVIDALVKQINNLPELENRLETKQIKEIANALIDGEDKGSNFLHQLINGEYTDYAYDKNLITLYKRIGASILAFNNEEFDEYFVNDLYDFAKSLIGQNMLKSLGLFDKYSQKPEEIQESNKE